MASGEHPWATAAGRYRRCSRLRARRSSRASPSSSARGVRVCAHVPAARPDARPDSEALLLHPFVVNAQVDVEVPRCATRATGPTSGEDDSRFGGFDGGASTGADERARELDRSERRGALKSRRGGFLHEWLLRQQLEPPRGARREMRRRRFERRRQNGQGSASVGLGRPGGGVSSRGVDGAGSEREGAAPRRGSRTSLPDVSSRRRRRRRCRGWGLETEVEAEAGRVRRGRGGGEGTAGGGGGAGAGAAARRGRRLSRGERAVDASAWFARPTAAARRWRAGRRRLRRSRGRRSRTTWNPTVNRIEREPVLECEKL